MVAANQRGDHRPRIREFLTTNFYVDSGAALTDQASLLDRGIIDSTGVMEVVEFLQQTFGIEVKDDELLPENLDSISRIDAFVSRKQAGG
jgi:acyl carrier protein